MLFKKNKNKKDIGVYASLFTFFIG